MKKLICVDCDIEFTPYAKKPGFINQCARCGSIMEDIQIKHGIERVGGNMIYEHKTGATIEIKPMRKAQAFAARTKRFGAGVTMAITESKLFHEQAIEGERLKLSNDYRDLNRAGQKAQS